MPPLAIRLDIRNKTHRTLARACLYSLLVCHRPQARIGRMATCYTGSCTPKSPMSHTSIAGGRFPTQARVVKEACSQRGNSQFPMLMRENSERALPIHPTCFHMFSLNRCGIRLTNPSSFPSTADHPEGRRARARAHDIYEMARFQSDIAQVHAHKTA